MKISQNITKLFLSIVGYLIFSGLSTFAVSAQEAVDLPAFTTTNTLTLERYPYDWNIRAGSNVRTQLFQNLSDKDVIHVHRLRDAVSSEKLEIVLHAGSLVKWWKGITLYKKISSGRDAGKWKRLQPIYTESGTRRSATISININQLNGTALSLEKAKAFGAHTPMYIIHLDDRRDDLGGQRITFIWEKDN